MVGGGPRVVVSTAAFHARVRGSVPGLGGLKETQMLLISYTQIAVVHYPALRSRKHCLNEWMNEWNLI